MISAGSLQRQRQLLRKLHDRSYASYWQPKYWPIWFGFALAWLITRLPFSLQLMIGSLFGRIGLHLAKGRRHIVEVNLSLCFPNLSAGERSRLTRDVFRSTGRSIIETANAWLRDPHDFLDRLTITGLAGLNAAIASGKGVLLVGMHFTTLDFCAALLATHVKYDAMYRRNRNPLFNLIMKRCREKHYEHTIERNDIRGIVNSLKKGHVVWYGPDQDYGRRHSVFVPFFGVPAATITATARFARMSGAPVVLFTHFRDENGSYRIELSAPLEGFPTGDDLADAALINGLVERAVRQKPDQYWWVHRRFKTRPPGEKRPY